jgi:hypothetical protein
MEQMNIDESMKVNVDFSEEVLLLGSGFFTCF